MPDCWIFDGVWVRAVYCDPCGNHPGTLVRHHTRNTPQHAPAPWPSRPSHDLGVALLPHHGSAASSRRLQLL